MRECNRGEAPELLTRYAEEMTEDYISQRRADHSFQFRWPQRQGQPLGHVVFDALSTMTDGRCAYCDLFPNAGGEDQIEHFRPKSRPEFYHLVCAWKNLYLACKGCNDAKQTQWEAALLCPDEPGFSFARYFSYRTDTCVLEPNAAASIDDQHRAQRTISIFNLNRPGACIMRRHMVKLMQRASSDEDLVDLGYRYLIPLCRGE